MSKFKIGEKVKLAKPAVYDCGVGILALEIGDEFYINSEPDGDGDVAVTRISVGPVDAWVVSEECFESVDNKSKPKFKVGDLVTAKYSGGDIQEGTTYVVLEVEDGGGDVSVGDKCTGEYVDGWGEENFDLAPEQERQQRQESSFSANDKVVFRDPRGFLFLGEYVRPHEANGTKDETPGGMHYVRRLRKDVKVDLYCLRTKYLQKVVL